MRRALTAALLALTLSAIAGCGVPSNSPKAYGTQTEDNFMAGCEVSRENKDDPAPEPPAVPASDCQCRYDWFVENVPYNSTQQENDKKFADYDGPTFTEINDKVSKGEAVDQNVLDQLNKACPSASADEASTTTTSGGGGPTTTAAKGSTTTTAAATTTSGG